METKKWKKWCRLCGKNNGSDVDATLKLKNTEILAENIRKYFGIVISDSDICTKICNVCNDTINSIVKYNSQVLKVNGMFLELEKSYLNENINLSSLRKRHGLNNNINGLSDTEMHETDVGLVKVDVKSTTLNNSRTAVKVKPCKVIVKKFSFKTKPEDNSTSKQTETDESIKHPNENSSVVFPFGLNDLDEVNLRCRYCNIKFHKKDTSIKHTGNHFNYILTCNICKKHFSTNSIAQCHKTIHLTNVKSKTLNNSPPPVDVKSCKVIEYNDISFKTKPEDNSTTKPTEIGKIITHSTDVKLKPLNNSVPSPCPLEMEIGDVTDVDLENPSSESNDELPLAHVKSKTLNNSPPPVDVNSCKVIEYSDISFKTKPEDNSTTKQTEIDEAIKPANENFSVVFPFGLNDLDEVNLRCRYCNKKFQKKDTLIKHTENHFNYILTCNVCKKHFCNKYKIQRHKTTHLTKVKSKTLNNSPPPVNVKSCKVIKYNDISSTSKPEDNSTTKQTEIDEAIKPPNENISVVFPFGLNNLDEVNLWCRYCNMKFHKKDSLIKHTGNHFNYILTCNICKKHFPTKQKTQRHKTTHVTNVKSKTLNNSIPPVCLIETEIRDVTDVNLENSVSSFESNDVWPKTCLNEDEMQQQTNIKQGGDDNINLNQEAKIPSVKEKFFACNICQKRFTFRGKTAHMRKHFANKDITQNPFPPLQCRVCGKSCKNLTTLRGHEAIHLPENERKSYECSYCKKKYNNKMGLKYHVRFVHKKDRSFMCEFCGRAFATNMNLRCHMLSHSKERKFKCSKCGKTCKRAFDLKTHIDTHEDTKYPCEICGIKLNTRRILRVHMLVHSDENKFKCNICSKQYKRLEQFKLHLMSHLKLKPFECFICNLTFASQTTCRAHQRTKHPVELAAADLTDKPKTAKNVPSMKSLYEFNEKALCK